MAQSESCGPITLELYDSFGDGWNGNTIKVSFTGGDSTFTLASGSSTSISLMVNYQDTAIFNWQGGGSYTYECSYAVKDAAGATLYTSPSGSLMSTTTAEDTIYCNTVSACSAPSALSATMGTTDAALSWTDGGSTYLYNLVEYGPAGFPSGFGDTMWVYADTAYISGLSPATAYDFHVTTICTSSDSSFTIAASNKFTLCAPVATPYTEDFDAVATGGSTNPSLPTCWEYYQGVGSSVYSTYHYIYGYNSNSPSNNLRLYRSSSATYNGDTAMSITPEIQGLDSAGKKLTFYGRKGYALYPGEVMIGVTNSTGDASSLRILDTLTMNSDSYEKYEMFLDSAFGIQSGDSRLAFVTICNGTYDYMYLDDVEVTDIPPCPEPINIALTGATQGSVTLSWTSNSSTFKVEMGPVGFTQGTGNVVTVTGTSYTATGLTQNSYYDVYVMTDCAASGDGTSSWVGPITVKTECGDQMAPYYTGFEGYTSGGSANPDLPDCWTYEKRSSSTSFYAYNNDVSSSAYAGTNYLYYYGYVSTTSTNSAEGDTLAIGSPRIMNLADNDKQIQFYGRGSTSSSTLYSANVIVAVADSTANLDNMHIVDTVTMGQSYQQYTVDLLNLPTYASRVMLVMIPQFNPASTSSYGYNYFYLDELNIRDIPTCPEPANVMANATSDTSLAMSWTDSSAVSQYFIEWGPTGFAQGTGAPIDTIMGTAWSVDTLMANTGYDFYIQSECASQNVNSPWVGPITVTTPCSPVATPFYDSFESSPGYSGNNSNPNLPGCWAYDDDGGSSYSMGYGYAYYALSGSYSLYNYMYSASGDTDVVSSPMIADLDEGKVLKFWARTASTSYPGQFDVVLTDAMGNYKTAKTVQAIDLMSNTTYTEQTIYLDSNVVAAGDMRVGFRFYGKPATYDLVLIDSVSIVDLPSCVSYNHELSSATDSSATVAWDYTGTSNCFNVEYGVPGFIQGTGTGSLAGTSVSNVSTPYTFSGLAPNTEYDYYVESCCNPGSWEGPFTFRTECTGPLMGTYTVGTGGDFGTLDSVVASLNSCGISGNVEFSLLSGSHYTSKEFGYINGTDNGSITIKGAAGANDTITGGLTLVGAQNITFDDIYIKSNGGNGIRLNGTNHITIKNSTIDVGVTTSSTTNGIVASGSATTIYSTTTGEDNLTIEDNTIIGGYFGVRLYGSTAASNDTVVISGNTLLTPYYYGVYVYYGTEVEMNENNASGFGSSYAYGLYNYQVNGLEMHGNYVTDSYYNYLYYTTNFNVTKNYISSGYYGLYLYYSGSSTSTNVLANNMFEANTYGIDCYYTSNVDIYHNTARAATGMYDYQSTDLDLRNNIFAGSSYPMYKYSTASTNTNFYDYNVLYNTGGDSIVAYFKGSARTLTALQAADTTMNMNSKEGNPMFINGLHVAGLVANDAGDNSVGITEDYDGDTRPYSGSTTVDIGADEYEPLNDDAELTALISPSNGCGGDSLMVEAIVTNLGFNTITSVAVGFDGAGASLSTTASVNLAFGESDTVMIGYFNQHVGGTYTATTYTNLTGDQRTTNDTLVSEVVIGDVQQVAVSYPMEVCAGDDVSMSVTHPLTGYFVWTSGSDTVATTQDDSTLTITGLMTDTSFTVASTSAQEFIATPTPTATWSGVDGIYFTVNDPAVFDSVSVFPLSATGSETVSIIDQSNGAVVYTTGISWSNASAGMETVIPLGVSLPAGYYLMERTTTTSGSWYDIYVGTGATGYPFYSTDSTVVLNQGTFSTYLEYFFNWHFTVGGCDRPDTTFNVMVTQDPVAALTVDTANAVVTATDWTVNWDASATTGADSVVVSISNGTSSTALNGAATFTANNAGETITVIAYGPCSSDTVTYTFDVAHISVAEDILNGTLAVYPNPSRGLFNVDLFVDGSKTVDMTLVNTLGQVLSSELITINGTLSKQFDLSNEPAGVYVLKLTTESGVVTRRITIE